MNGSATSLPQGARDPARPLTPQVDDLGNDRKVKFEYDYMNRRVRLRVFTCLRAGTAMQPDGHPHPLLHPCEGERGEAKGRRWADADTSPGNEGRVTFEQVWAMGRGARDFVLRVGFWTGVGRPAGYAGGSIRFGRRIMTALPDAGRYASLAFGGVYVYWS